jgi:hypothetical protein
MTKTSARTVAFWSGPALAIFIAISWIYSVQSSYRFALGHNPYFGLDSIDGQLRLTLRYEPRMEFDPGAPVQFTTGSPAEDASWFAKSFYYHPDPDYSIVTFGIASWLAFSGFLLLWVAALLVARKFRRRRANGGRQGQSPVSRLGVSAVRLTCFLCVGLVGSAPLFVVDSLLMGIGISLACVVVGLAVSERLFRALSCEQNSRSGKDLS